MAGITKPSDPLLLLSLMGVILGLILGASLYPLGLSRSTVLLLAFPGEILNRVLQLLILPVVLSSLTHVFSTLDKKSSMKIGLYQGAYYLTTTSLASVTGILLVSAIQPGYRVAKDSSVPSNMTETTSNSMDSVLDVMRNVFTDNIFRATFQLQLTESTEFILRNETNGEEITTSKKRTTFIDAPNILGLITFCFAFGSVAAGLGSDVSSVLQFLRALERIFLKMATLFIWYFPLGILFVMMGSILEMDDPIDSLKSQSYFIITVLAGIAFHGLITLRALQFVFVRRNPYRIIGSMAQAMVTAFGTTTSFAALPMSFECLEKNEGIRQEVARVWMTLGGVLNVDGTALYESVAAVYLLQLNNIPLTVGNVIGIRDTSSKPVVFKQFYSLTCTMSGMGTTILPTTGLKPLFIVAAVYGIPAADVLLLLPLDWFLSRCRAALNVLGDATGACIANKLIGDGNSKAETAKWERKFQDLESPRLSLYGDFASDSPKLGKLFRRRVRDLPEPIPVSSIHYISGSTISI